MSTQHWTMDQDSCSGAFSGTSGHSQEPGSRGGAAFVENVDHGYYQFWIHLKEDALEERKHCIGFHLNNQVGFQIQTQDGPWTRTRIATALLGSSVI